ncbi:hypothetical protein BC833DRAFT_578833 [Globomyces pollinis-pini]|nr:hypothetical protein BC833DRAFT_578833 [Globomyces pollinis-pini]
MNWMNTNQNKRSRTHFKGKYQHQSQKSKAIDSIREKLGIHNASPLDQKPAIDLSQSQKSYSSNTHQKVLSRKKSEELQVQIINVRGKLNREKRHSLINGEMSRTHPKTFETKQNILHQTDTKLDSHSSFSNMSPLKRQADLDYIETNDIQTANSDISFIDPTSPTKVQDLHVPVPAAIDSSSSGTNPDRSFNTEEISITSSEHSKTQVMSQWSLLLQNHIEQKDLSNRITRENQNRHQILSSNWMNETYSRISGLARLVELPRENLIPAAQSPTKSILPEQKIELPHQVSTLDSPGLVTQKLSPDLKKEVPNEQLDISTNQTDKDLMNQTETSIYKEPNDQLRSEDIECTQKTPPHHLNPISIQTPLLMTGPPTDSINQDLCSSINDTLPRSDQPNINEPVHTETIVTWVTDQLPTHSGEMSALNDSQIPINSANEMESLDVQQTDCTRNICDSTTENDWPLTEVIIPSSCQRTKDIVLATQNIVCDSGSESSSIHCGQFYQKSNSITLTPPPITADQIKLNTVEKMEQIIQLHLNRMKSELLSLLNQS